MLSRGEKKLLITALRLSQLPLLLSTQLPDEREPVDGTRLENMISKLDSFITPVVLLDDITAELDDRALDILLSTLAQLPCQVFMTSLTTEVIGLVNEYWSYSSVFHMKQGVLSSLD